MIAAMGKWIQEKKLKYEVTEQSGFENLPKALNALFHGTNLGKMVVKV
jgi:NADPH-dependent curcumin reductase CurA